jgi:hypothetical protein
MTAASGDALSHVNFQTRQNAVLTDISASRIPASGFRQRHAGLFPLGRNRFLSYLHGGYEAASRNEPGRLTSFDHYLPKSFRSKT